MAYHYESEAWCPPWVRLGSSVPTGQTVVLDNTGNEKLALSCLMRGRISEIKNVHVFLTDSANDGEQWRIRLETLSGATPADPSGTLFHANAQSGYSTVNNADDNTWRTATFASAVPVAAGNHFFAVIESNSGNTGNIQFQAFTDGWFAGNLINRYNNGSSWGNANWGSCIAFDDGAGNWEVPLESWPAYARGADEVNFGSAATVKMAGNKVTFNQDQKFDAVQVWGDFDISAQIKFYDTDGTTVLATASVDEADRSGSNDPFFWLPFDTEVTVTGGSTYYVGVTGTGGLLDIHGGIFPDAACLEEFLGYVAEKVTTTTATPTGTGDWSAAGSTQWLYIGLRRSQVSDSSGGRELVIFDNWPPSVSAGPTFTASILDPGEKIALWAQVTGRITSISDIHVYIDNIATNGDGFKIRLETSDLAGPPSDPSGTLFHANGESSDTTLTTGDSDTWQTANFSSAVPVSRGDAFFIVIEALSGNTSAIQVVAGFNDGRIVGVPNSRLYNGSSWTTFNFGSVGILYDGSSGYEVPIGFVPYVSEGSADELNSGASATNKWVGNRINFPAARKARVIGFWGDFDEDATVKVFDSDGTTVLATGTFESDYRGLTSYALMWCVLDSQVTFSANTNYYIAIQGAANLTDVYGRTYPSATIRAAAHGDIDLAKAVSTVASPTGTGDWTVTTTQSMWVTIFLEEVGAGLSAVGNEIQIVHNISAAIGASLQVVYDVGAAVGAALQIVHDISAAVGSELELVHNISTAVGTEFSTLWNVTGKAGQSIELVWSVEGAPERSQGFAYVNVPTPSAIRVVGDEALLKAQSILAMLGKMGVQVDGVQIIQLAAGSGKTGRVYAVGEDAPVARPVIPAKGEDDAISLILAIADD